MLAPMKASLVPLLLTLLASNNSDACSPETPSEETARTADAVLVGEVLATHQVESPFDLLVSVKVLETLKGSAPGRIQAHSPCGAPFGIGKRVVVLVFNGNYIVFSSRFNEQALRKGVAIGR